MTTNPLNRREFVSVAWQTSAVAAVPLVTASVAPERLRASFLNTRTDREIDYLGQTQAYWIAKLETGNGTIDRRLVPSDRARIDVVTALLAMRDSVIPDLLQILDSNNRFAVFEALATLVQMRTSDAIEAIRVALTHRRSFVRELTIACLAREWHGDYWRPSIVKALKDDDPAVRYRAERVLGMSRGPLVFFRGVK